VAVDASGNFYVSELNSWRVRKVAKPAGGLGYPTWSLFSYLPGQTGVTSTWTFKVATTASLASVRFTLPSGTTAPGLALGALTGLPGGGSLSFSAGALTYTFATTTVNANTAVTLAVNGISNSATPGASTSTITTRDGSTNTVDTAASDPVV